MSGESWTCATCRWMHHHRLLRGWQQVCGVAWARDVFGRACASAPPPIVLRAVCIEDEALRGPSVVLALSCTNAQTWYSAASAAEKATEKGRQGARKQGASKERAARAGRQRVSGSRKSSKRLRARSLHPRSLDVRGG